MSSLPRLERQRKDFFKSFRIRILLFPSYLFGIETTNTMMHYRSFLKNHTRFQTKTGEVYTRFQTKTAQKQYHLGLPASQTL